MQKLNRGKISPSKEIAYIAVTCALLLGGQYVFSFVVGVEVVTLILACFACVFGIKRGVICAVSFSLLRCLIYGFYPTVVILYLVYYPFLAAVFGGLGHIKDKTFESFPLYFAVIINLLLLGLAAACAVCYCLDLIKVSRVYKYTVYALLWVIFALCLCLCIAFDGLFIAKKFFKKDTTAALKVITFASVGAVCTVLFTLLDDIITPLFFGYSKLTSLAYFYSSFTAMLPQTVCTIVTFTTLFLPLTSVLKRAAKF
ncbi:MAG: hypothetical protein K2G38_06650 [Clostridia bacterium]|nr:hypothetical protein [Clostridia bacterium]